MVKKTTSKTKKSELKADQTKAVATGRAIDQPFLTSISQRTIDAPATNVRLTGMAKEQRTFDARPDGADFRDLLFNASLVEVPPRISLHSYLQFEVPVLDQGNEGACTGFGLATVANYLLRRRTMEPDFETVSPRMFYEMAKRYDEWPGEEYSGSSARGAMKGWYKHGVCSEALWPYHDSNTDSATNAQRTYDAVRSALGAYYRVNHKDLIAMHSALVEVGILYATALVHEGWKKPTENFMIEPSDAMLGGTRLCHCRL